MRLIDRTIRTLEPPAKGSKIYYDDELKGFGFRITAAGARSFVLNYWIDGRERRITLGGWPALTSTAAREMALEAKAGIAKGTDPLAVREARRNDPTVAELCDDYMSLHAERHKRSRSIQQDRSMIDRFIKPELGKLRVSDPGLSREIEDLHRKLSMHPYQANRVLALISKMFSLAVKWRWRSDNPARGITRNAEAVRESTLKPDEAERLVAALAAWRAKGKRYDRTADAIELLLLTGARRSEVLGMRWEQLDLEAGVWTKPAATTKQKKTHVVPLVEPAVAILRRLEKRDEDDTEELSAWVFPNRTKEDAPLGYVKKAWAAILKNAKLPGLRLHDLRHSYATALVESGVSLELVARLLGHTQAATTRRYAHPDVEALRAVATKAQEWRRPKPPVPPSPNTPAGNVVPFRRFSATQ